MKMTDDDAKKEVDRYLKEAVKRGDVKIAARGVKREHTRIEMTKKGIRAARKILTDAGVDPDDKEAVERFLFGEMRCRVCDGKVIETQRGKKGAGPLTELICKGCGLQTYGDRAIYGGKS